MRRFWRVGRFAGERVIVGSAEQRIGPAVADKTVVARTSIEVIVPVEGRIDAV